MLWPNSCNGDVMRFWAEAEEVTTNIRLAINSGMRLRLIFSRVEVGSDVKLSRGAPCCHPCAVTFQEQALLTAETAESIYREEREEREEQRSQRNPFKNFSVVFRVLRVL